jgi:hypothetical protein
MSLWFQAAQFPTLSQQFLHHVHRNFEAISYLLSGTFSVSYASTILFRKSIEIAFIHISIGQNPPGYNKK